MKSYERGIFQVFIIIIIVLISAGVAGAGVWYWQQQEMKKLENSLKTGVTKPKTTPSPSMPSSATSTAPASCQKVAQQGVAVFITLNASGADQSCILVSKDATVAITNNTGKLVTVTLGNRTRTAESGSSTGFDGEVGGFLQTGENKMQVSAYNSTQYPSIWVY